MRARLPFLLALLLPLAAAAPENAVEVLDASWGDTCAPWDGAALSVEVESLGLRVMIYGADMERFRKGRAIAVKRDAAGVEDEATVFLKDGPVKFKRVAAEVRLDPKTGRGRVVVDGAAHPVRFKKRPGGPQFCG